MYLISANATMMKIAQVYYKQYENNAYLITFYFILYNKFMYAFINISKIYIFELEEEFSSDLIIC